MLYFEVLQDGFVKRPCDADLVCRSSVLDVKVKKCEKTEGDCPTKYLLITNNSKKRKKKDQETYLLPALQILVKRGHQRKQK